MSKRLKGTFTPESYPDYLRRVGADYRESGREATAEDYETAAQLIEDLADAAGHALTPELLKRVTQ